MATAALLGPWAALGRRRFTSLDLISSASALEVIEGRTKQYVLAAWMVIPVLTAAGYVLAAVSRWRLLAVAFVLAGPTYAAALLAIRWRSPLRTLWALHLGVAAAVVTSLIGLVLLLQARSASAVGTPAEAAPATSS